MSIALWRELAGRPGPAERLSAAEESRVAGAVRRLSAGLTDARGLAGHRYLDDPDLLGAYLLFFAEVSRAQARAILGRLGPGGGAALDLGAGPGPLTAVLLERGFASVVAADHSPQALAILARAFADAPVRAVPWTAGDEGALPPGPFALITAGHLFNELDKRAGDRIERRAALCDRLAPRLAPGGRLVLLDPASHALNLDLLALRDALLARGWQIEAPCFLRGPCPALAQRAVCHAELRWRAPRLVARLAERAHLDKEVLAYSYLVLRAPGPPLPPADPRDVRVASELLRNKAGRERRIVCGVAGRFSLSAPGGDGRLRRLARGDALRVVAPEMRESGWGVGPSTLLERPPEAADR